MEGEGEPQISLQHETHKQRHPKAEPPFPLTGSLHPSLCPFPKPQTGHCGRGARLGCGGTSTTCFPAPPSPQVLPGLGFSRLPPPHERLEEPGACQSPLSAPQGPTKPPQGEASPRTAQAQGRGLRQPSLVPQGKREATASIAPKTTATTSAHKTHA